MEYYVTVGDDGSFAADKDGALYDRKIESEKLLFSSSIENASWSSIALLAIFLCLGLVWGCSIHAAVSAPEEYDMQRLLSDPYLRDRPIVPLPPLPDERRPTFPVDPHGPKTLQI